MENTLTEMVENTVSNNIQNIVQQTVDQRMESLNQNPPEWFTNQMRELKEDMDSRFKMSEYKHACLYNMVRRMNGSPAAPVPFLNVEAMLDELSPIGSVEDIDSLSKQECQTYLRAYNVEFHPNESVKLKGRLRDAIGLATPYDRKFQFRNFI